MNQELADLAARLAAESADPLASERLRAAYEARKSQVDRQLAELRDLLATPNVSPDVPPPRFTPAHLQALDRGIQSLAVQPVVPTDVAQMHVVDLESQVRAVADELAGERVAVDQLLAQVRLVCAE